MRDRRSSSAEDDTEKSDQSVRDMRAAEACVDQAHITTYSSWQATDLSEDQYQERDDDILDLDEGLCEQFNFLVCSLLLKRTAVEVQYTEEFAVTLYQLSADRKWLDLGPGQLILEACIYSSRASKPTCSNID